MRALAESLAHLGPLTLERVALPDCGASLCIARPTDFDRLLDAAAGDPEQHLPYWAEIWPSGVALAAMITRRSEALGGRPVLELGCGLGLTAVAALRAGARLLATDYSPDALALCRLNCRRETGAEPATRQFNWRCEDPLRAAGETAYPLVLAADVLYERRDVAPLLGLVRRVVAPGGELWLAEPGRAPAADFLESVLAWGWAHQEARCAGPWPDNADNEKGVVVATHALRRPSA